MTDLPSGEISSEPAGHAVPGASTNLTRLVVFRNGDPIILRDSEPESDDVDPNHQNIQDLELGADLNYQNTQDMIVNTENLPSAQEYEGSAGFWASVEADDDYVCEFFLPPGIRDGIQLPNWVQTLKQKVEIASGFQLGNSSCIQVVEPPMVASKSLGTADPESIRVYRDKEQNWTGDPFKLHDSRVVGPRENNKVISYPSLVPQMNGNITDAEEKHNRLKRGRKRKMDSLTLEAVEKFFGKPIEEAAKSLDDMPSGEISSEPSGHAAPSKSTDLTPLVVFRRDSQPESDNVDPNHQNIQDLELGADLNYQNTQDKIVNAQQLTSLPGLHDPALSTENWPSAQQYESDDALWELLWADSMIQKSDFSASNVSFGSRENNKVISHLNVIPQMNDNITDAEEKHNPVKQDRKRKRDSLTMEAVEKHRGKRLGEACEIFGVSRSTLKRFCREHGISSWPLPKHNGDDPAVSKSTVQPKYANIPDIKMVTVKATYEEDMIKFQFPTSSGLLELKQEVARRIDLKGRKLRLRYKDEENELITLGCDDDLLYLLGFTVKHSTIKLIAEGR